MVQMDEVKEALAAIAERRPIPHALREKLEAVFASLEAEPLPLAGLDAPRPIPSRLSHTLMTVMTGGKLRRALGLSPIVTTLGTLSAAALIIIGAVLFGGEDASTPLPGKPKSSPSSDIVAIATPDPGLTPTAGTAQPRNTLRPGAANGSRSGAARSGPPRSSSSTTEACFEEERCIAIREEYASAGDGTNSGSTSQPSPTATRAVRAPTPPRDVTAEPGPGIGQITIRWRAPEDAGSSPLRKYALYRTDPDGTQVTVAILEVDTLSYTDSDLPFGSYSYRLRARNSDAISGYSSAASAMSINSPS